MCGIAGIARIDGIAVDRNTVIAMTDRLKHRGPDGEGFHFDGAVGLGHRRLAIIDLEGGRQPLANETGSVQLVANAEIYNFRELRRDLEQRGHVFRTGSDCEVIVHGYEEWGSAVVDRLRGMFALALWDAEASVLLLARDRLGIKPLCWSQIPGGLAFASEMQALEVLEGVDRSLDMAAIDLFLHQQYIPAPHTAYTGVHKLEPGTRLVLDLGKGDREPRMERYWHFDWAPEPDDEATWIERLDAAVSDAVRSHLVSDVPFGAFLSGGVDSSTVVGFMGEALDSLPHTFTIGFDESDHDERDAAREASRRIGTRHQEQVLDLNILGLLPSLVAHFGEPFGDSSALCTWEVCRAARRDVKMVLSGDGGDELFGGYSYYPKLVSRHADLSDRRRRLRRAAGDVLRRAGLLTPAPGYAEFWMGRSPWFSEGDRHRLWRPELRPGIAVVRDWHDSLFAAAPAEDPLSAYQSADLSTYLPFDNLTKVDIASSAHGLEVRVPLLDDALVELARRLPASLRLRNIEQGGERLPCGKYALKRVAARFHPWDFLTRRKMGFSVPLDAWFARMPRGELRERLLESDSGLAELFEVTEIEALIDRHRKTRREGHRLWMLLFVAEWHRWRADAASTPAGLGAS